MATVRTRLPELEDKKVTRSRVYGLLHGLHPNAVESCADVRERSDGGRVASSVP